MSDLIDAYELSPQQERLWQRPGKAADFRSWLVVRLRGALDLAKLSGALGHLVEMQETLRTRFLETDDGPVQVIEEKLEVALNHLDLRNLSAGKEQHAVSSFLEDRARRLPDAALGGQTRMTLAHISEDSWLLIFDLPTLLADTWSLVQIFEQLAAAYGVLRRVAAHEKPMPYAQFSAWQRQLLELEETAEDRSYWLAKGELPLSEFELPLERRRPSFGVSVPGRLAGELPGAPSSRVPEASMDPAGAALGTGRAFHRTIRHLGPEEVRHLERHAAPFGLPEEAFLLMGWALLMARSIGNPEVVLTRTSRGRAYEELDRSVGLFEKSLPVNLRISLEAPFLAGVRAWAREIEEGEDWQEYFDGHLLDGPKGESRVGGAWGNPRPLALGFDFCACPSERGVGGIQLSLAGLSCRIEHHLLRLSCRRLVGGLRLELEGDRQVFEAVDLDRLGERLETLLDAALVNPQRKAETLPLLGTRERQQVVSGFNRTGLRLAGSLWESRSQSAPGVSEFPAESFGNAPRELLLHRHVEVICRRYPERAAMVCAGRQLTYRELDARSTELAFRLVAMGAGPDVLVGVCLERSLELVVVLLAVLKAGAAYLPLDPSYPPDRLGLMARDSRAVFCVAATLDGVAAIFPSRRVLLVPELEGSEALETSGQEVPGDQPLPSNAAYVIYTSGSTGTPKGAINTHGAVVNRLLWMRDALKIGEEDVVLHKTPLSFDVSVWELFLPLMTGARLVIAEPEGHRDPAYLARLMRDEGVTLAHFVPSLLDVFLVEPGIEELDSLRHVVASGEALSPQLRDRFLSRLGARLYNLYGPTEAAIDVTATRCHPSRPENTVPIGHPISNLRIFLLDNRGEPVPVGVTAELYIAGVGLSRGYLRRPALTASRFLPDALSGIPGARLYRTGDLAHWSPDGNLIFQGRSDDQLKVSGFRVEPGEIVAVLERHPEIRTAVVLGRRDSPLGLRLVAYVVPTPGARISAGRGSGALLEAEGCFDLHGLRDFLSRSLPTGMIPAEFVLLAALPLLPNGKLDRQALPAPQRLTTAVAAGPTNAVEERLLDIWQEVLAAPSIGIHDDFLTLGGDSIQAMQIVARAHRWGLDLVPGELFSAPTVAELARQARRNRATPQVMDDLSGPIPLTPIQHWFASQRLSKPEHWNQAVLLETVESLDLQLLEAAGRALVEHHDALRLCFRRQGEAWVQECRPVEEVFAAGPVTVTFDLQALEENALGMAVEEVCAGLQGSLNLETGPLFRIAWMPTVKGGRLFLLCHHLVVDGVSWRLLLEDLESAYRHVDHLGRSQPLPPKSTSYSAWSRYLENWVQGTDLTSTLAAWRDLPWGELRPLPGGPLKAPSEIESAGQAEGVGKSENTGQSENTRQPKSTGTTEITARPDSDTAVDGNTVGDARTVTRRLGRGATRTLLTEMLRLHHTGPLDVLLAALARTLGDWSGGDQILVDLEGHGREDLASGSNQMPDISRTVGWFTSIFPVVLPAARRESPGQLLSGVKECLRNLPHNGASFGLLRYGHPDSAVRSELSGLPQAQVSFNFLGQFDSQISSSQLFVPSSQGCGSARYLGDSRRYRLEVDAWVEHGCLEMIWTYGGRLNTAAEIELLADRFLEALEVFLDPERRQSTAEFLASDYPLSELPARELEALVAAEGGSAQVEDIFPLANSQEGMLLYLLLHEGLPGALAEPLGGGPGRVFFNQLHGDLQGSLDEVLFRKVWQSMVDRHGALRTLIRWRGLSNPMQVVRAQAQLPWQEEDWCHLEAAAQQEELRSFLACDRSRPFSLDQEPLLRVSLLRLEPERTRFVLSYHHLVLDGWSVSLLLKEAFSLYEALIGGTDSLLEPAPRFSEYVAWQGQQSLFEAEEFWRASLEGITAPAPLRVGRSEGVAGGGDLRLRRRLESGLTTALKACARRARVTLNTVVQGAWALLLHELTRSQEVVFGSVVSGRDMGFASTLGLFINALPVRAGIDRGQRLDDWLQGLQSTQLAQRRYEFCPLEQIQRWSGLPREQALFETLIVFENYPVEEALLQGRAGLRVASLEVEERTNYPLALFVFPGPELEFELNGDGGRFEPETANLLALRFCLLLSRLAEQPAATLGELVGPDAAQRQQILQVWSRSERSVALNGGVHNLFEARARRDPAAPAVLVPGDGVQPKEVISYGKLERQANQLAHELCSRGVGPETVVALQLPRSMEMLVAVLAVLKAGGAYLPLDTNWPASRCRWVMEDAGARLLVTDGSLSLPFAADSTGPVSPSKDPERAEVEVLDLPEFLGRGLRRWPTVPPQCRVNRHSLAYIIYTSGSSGRPKGVMVEHGSLVSHALASAEEFNLSQRDRVLQFASLAFDASAEEIFPCWSRGASLVLRTDAMLDSAEGFWTRCSQWGVTVVDLPTSFWHRMVADPKAPASLPQRLRLVILGGEKAQPEALETWRRRYRDEVVLLNTYGPTETTVAVSSAVLSVPTPLEPSGADVKGATLVSAPVPPEVSIGRPLAHARIYLLDPQGDPVALGVPGQLYVAGNAPGRGYKGRPALTAAAFQPDPHSENPGGRRYRTGDLARWVDRGEMQFLGRLDSQLKVRGYRVEPLEIETALEGHRTVREAAVVLHRENDRDRLVAYVAAEGELDTEVLRTHLREQFPEYMVPSLWIPVMTLSRTAGGKIDRGSLPSPRIGQTSTGEGAAWQAPRNETEEAMAAIFADLLEVEQVGAFDHFFDLGGHSLLATRLVARVREIFEVDLPLRQVFESPTVAKLAAEVVSLILDQLEELSEEELDALS